MKIKKESFKIKKNSSKIKKEVTKIKNECSKRLRKRSTDSSNKRKEAWFKK